MKAKELAEFLLRHPDHLVQLESPDQIAPANGAEIDAFDADEGPCVVISGAWDD